MSAFGCPTGQRHVGSLPTTSLARNQADLPLDDIVDPAVLSTFESAFKPGSLPATLSGLSLKSYTRHMLSSFGRLGEIFTKVCPENYKTRRPSWYLASAAALQSHISAQPHFSLQTTAAHLREQELLEPSQVADDDATTNHLHHFYVFCLVGISAHLFQPSAKGQHVHDIFIIEDCVPGSIHRCWSILSNKIMMRDPETPVSMLIRGFGELSPVMDRDQRTYQTKTPTLRADRFDARLFCSVLKMKIAWTDILNTHLDYDADNNTLFLFRHATFCAMNATFSKTDRGNTSIWQSCIDLDGPDDGESDYPKDLMCEIMLSLYMIFGQEAHSRKYFSAHKAFEGWPQADLDPLLAIICRGQWPFPNSTSEPKPVYYLGRDFPLMQAKIDFLNDVIAHKEPKSLAQLWRDKRNTAQWYTFWAVIFYGTLGLLLAVAQLTTSIVALYK
ncbi:hypothetical protein QBC37DRAFT_488184 [Rhypophila decipiens]|uniref:Uncharacterized protein n=1 Tax=Rhypophila decipiens TaxID=261697 RepID=A0AAN6XZ48_9PEZI|nr:hypothetical protein QBC37DRAFT_488184 [Rhypophila decipiens]